MKRHIHKVHITSRPHYTVAACNNGRMSDDEIDALVQAARVVISTEPGVRLDLALDALAEALGEVEVREAEEREAA